MYNDGMSRSDPLDPHQAAREGQEAFLHLFGTRTAAGFGQDAHLVPQALREGQVNLHRFARKGV